MNTDRPDGFTLIEVLVTMVIIAIAAGLTAPALIAMAPNMALKSMAQELYSDIQKAKVKAIKENRSVSITFAGGGYSIWEPFNDVDNDGIFDAGESYTDLDGDGAYSEDKSIIFANENEYGIAFGTGKAADPNCDWNNAACAQTPRVTFNPRGLALLQNGSVFIENRNSEIAYAVTVFPTGSVKGRKYDGADPAEPGYNAPDHWTN